MSRCVEKPFAPLWAVGSYQGVSPRAPPRGHGIGGAGFRLREGGISVGGNGCTACYYWFCTPSCRPQR